jgi:hypothetical protein
MFYGHVVQCQYWRPFKDDENVKKSHQRNWETQQMHPIDKLDIFFTYTANIFWNILLLNTDWAACGRIWNAIILGWKLLRKPNNLQILLRGSRLSKMHRKAPICDTLWAAVFVAKVFKTCKLHEVYRAKLSKWRANRVENLGLLT